MSTNIPEHLQNILSQLQVLSQEDLRLINQYIFDRSKALTAQGLEQAIAKFTPGDSVSFVNKQGITQYGTVLKINKKTVGVSSHEGDRWNVSPQLLTLSISPDKQLGYADLSGTASVTTLPTSQNNAANHLREWVGGTITLPGYITGEPGDNYCPLMPVWLNEYQQVIGMSIITPDDPTFNVIASLKDAIANPSTGSPGAPSHLRVNDKAVAKQLQQAFPSIKLSVGPTPELDEVAEAMANEMASDGAPQLYSDIADSNYSVDSFFKASAALYTFAPWKIIPHDECLIGITAESLGITDGVISIIGQHSETFGVILFDSLNDYERYGLFINAIERGTEESLPAHRALTFDNANDISPEIRKDIIRNQWKVADSNAYPSLICPVHDRQLRPITEDDIELFDVIAQALQLALGKTKFVDALQGRGTFEPDYQILTKNRPVLITLQAPYPYKRVFKALGAPNDLIAELLLLERTASNEPDWDKHHVITTKLLNQYLASPEGKACDSELGSASLIMDMAFNYCSCTIASITPLAFEEVLFSIIPRKVMIQPGDATDIINDSRAFLHFLIREYGLARAKACLKILDSHAVSNLAKALGDSGNFGIGKSSLTSTNPFSIFEQSSSMTEFHDIQPNLPTTKFTDKKSRKKKRSASRKARKKNR